MPKKAKVKYRSLRSNLIHLPLSLYASLTQQQIRPQSLVLHLEPLTPSSSRAVAAYLGWSGLASASSLAGGVGGEETLEIDPEVAMSLGWNEGMLVEVGINMAPTKARSVSVTPVSEDDWEILEQHASFLEENLLMQLRAATKGRIYDIWVNRTKIRIRVDETTPKTSESSTVLLYPGTEIYVAPRLRKAVTAQPSGSTSSSASVPQSDTKGKSKGKNVKMRLIPGQIAGQWGIPTLDEGMEIGELENVLLCSRGSLRRVRRKLASEEEGEGAIHVRLERPSLPKARGRDKEGEEDKEGKEEDEGLEGWLVAWDEMPGGCCVLAGAEKEGWARGLIRLSAATPPRGRLKGSRTKSSTDLQFPATPPTLIYPGLDKIRDEGIGYLRRTILTSSRPLLITGGKGSGKSSIANAIAEALEADRDVLAEPIYHDVARLDGDGRVKKLKAKLEEWFEDARTRRPALMILDGLDGLLGPEHELTPSTQPTILAEVFCRLCNPDNLDGIMVIATASNTSSLHPLISTKHVFGETIKIAPLTKERRRDILVRLVEDAGTAPDDGGVDYVTLASKTEGYSISDLRDLVANTTQQAIIRQTGEGAIDSRLTMDDFTLAQAAFTPVSLRGVTLQKSSVEWSDIGGLHEPRRILRETLEWPTKYAQIFASCPLRLRSGLLLYGYPGCGKTLLASAVAKECGLNFISVKGPEILNKYIGASEKSVRDLFERASAAKPCILFFDEFDSIAPKRGHDSTGVTDRVVNQMLTEMDGAQGLDGVYVLAATSRPDLIDSALLRPGRLDKSLICDMPNEEERLEILEAVARKLTMSPDVDLRTLAKDSTGFSGADLQALVYNAHLEVVHSSISEAKSLKDNDKRDSIVNGKGAGGKGTGGAGGYRQIAPSDMGEKGISSAARSEMEKRASFESMITRVQQADEQLETIINNTSGSSGLSVEKAVVAQSVPVIDQHHLLKSLSSTRPSVAPVDRARLRKIYSAFSNDRDGNMTNGDMGRGTGTRATLM